MTVTMVKREKDFEHSEVIHAGHISSHESPYCSQLFFFLLYHIDSHTLNSGF